MIALNMIALGTGDELVHLRRALDSALPYMDALYITLTDEKDKLDPCVAMLNELQDKYMKKVEISFAREELRHTVDKEQIKWLTEFFGWEPMGKEGDSLFLFDVARNYALSKVPKEYEWVMWMDTDDVFRGGKDLAKVLQQAKEENLEAIYMNYVYEVEMREGKIVNILIEHLRERIIKNADLFKWVAPIHETLVEQRLTTKKDFVECDVLHLAEHADRVASLQRNIKNLEYSIYMDKGEDPRPIYYLAKAFYDLRTKETDEKSKKLIYIYLRGPHRSGWKEERAQACEYLAEIYKRNGELDNSIVELMNALIENETPTIFLNLASAYMAKGEWDRSLFWANLAMKVENKKTTLVQNPKETQGKLLEVLYNCHLNLGHIDEAWALMIKLIDLYPDDENLKAPSQFIEGLRQQRDMTRHVIELASYLARSGEAAKIKALLSAAPAVTLETPYVQDLIKKNFPPKIWGDKEIAIMCGQGFTPWTSKSLDNKGGSFVGGSEEAVILLSKELTKLGWRVTVYNDPGVDEGVIDGVEYKYYYKFNPADQFNILISWRYPEFVDHNYKAKKIYLWCHDILSPLVFTPERVAKYTKIIVQSKWHRENIPDVPDDKILISSNGIV